jgi:hypothetical protein
MGSRALRPDKKMLPNNDRTGSGLGSLATILATASLLASLPTASVRAGDSVHGGWLSPSGNNWPLVGIHAALTPDGRVLSYGSDGSGRQTGYFIYDVWDPAAGLNSGHITLDNLTRTDLFCSAQIILPQNGRILIAGGDNWTGSQTTHTGNNSTNLYRYSDDTLSPSGKMNRPRWYASTTVLANGDIYLQGGSGGDDRPEVRASDGTFRLLTGVDTSALDFWYPRNFVAADGRIFGFDTAGRMYYVDTTGAGKFVSAGALPSNKGRTSTAAMFRPGRILHFGGDSRNALVIDFRGGTPVVTPTQPLSSQRQWASATILADGTVLATGGSAVANELIGVNNAAEIWNPATGTWTVGASGIRPRLYHSGALLLPDASVLVLGGGAKGPVTNLNAEIFYPPYLYSSAGGFRSRPKIISAPTTIEAGTDFAVVSSSEVINRITLIKTGSATHSVNMDQRFLELAFTQSSTTSFVHAPAAADAPPGYYLLFIFDDRGTPSVSSMVRINAAGSTGTADETVSIGGDGGVPYIVSCNAAEALVGVFGLASDTYLKRIGARCVPVDASGRWVGNPIDRGATGGSSGTAYTRTCPRDFAVSGFKGRASAVVNQLRLECQALDASGTLAGSGQYLEAIGGSAGTSQGPYRCSSRHPGHALAGRSSGRIDAIRVQCQRTP